MLTTNPFDPDAYGDKLREECGVFGIWGADAAAAIVALGLHALQHRGQEAAGITSRHDHHFHSHRALGRVGDIFAGKSSAVAKLPGEAAIGHVRYATTGETAVRNVQPLFADLALGGFAVAHNGNISNAMFLRNELNRRGSIFQSTSDTEVIIHLVATSTYRDLLDRFIDALRRVEGAYSLVCLTDAGMIACRDPLGIRPLVMGKLGPEENGAVIFASETVALDVVGATYIRSVNPGELIIVNDEGVRSLRPFGNHQPRPCIFEHVYFSRPDSVVDGTSVYTVRKQIGAELARENAVDADMVVPVPDSGVPAAIGYAQESGLPYTEGLIKNRYIGRTFIQPDDRIRKQGVKLKFNPLPSTLAGKRVILVDDSIVRGNTSGPIVRLLRDSGAAEVHVRVSSPPIRHPCFMGVDMATYPELIAHRMDVPEIQDYIQADSLAYLSYEGLLRATGRDPNSFCGACFTGKYPIPNFNPKARDEIKLVFEEK
jgi:amidophosphoribosyltransferase